MEQTSLYTQGQRGAARVLLTVWLLASYNPKIILAAPESEAAIVPTTSASPPGQPALGTLTLPVDRGPAADTATVPSSQRAATIPPRTPDQLASRFLEPKHGPALRPQPGPVAEEDKTSPNDLEATSSPATLTASAKAALVAYYQQQEQFCQVPSFFPEEPMAPMEAMQCHLMLLEQSNAKPDQGIENQAAVPPKRLEWVKNPIALQDLFKKRSIKPGEPQKKSTECSW